MQGISRGQLGELGDELSGAKGANREGVPQLQISATTDVEAMHRFLDEYEQSPGTSAVYQREIERALLWSVYEKKKAFSSLNRSDFEDYLHFLANPTPREIWCGPRKPRGDPGWKPFVGALGPSARAVALAALGSFCGYLVDGGYLRKNPLALIRQRGRKMALGDGTEARGRISESAAKVERFLDEDMWAAVARAVEAMPRKTKLQCARYERLRFVCALLYLMAPRAGELQAHTMGSFREVRGRWWWRVVGKGRVEDSLPVPQDMLSALSRYRRFLGLSALPSSEDTTPLLVAVSGEAPITARRLNQVLKELFARAGQFLPPAKAYKAEKLRQASAHWGRHTSITSKVDSGIEARYVQRSARHQDPRTTRMYTHEEEQAWHDEAQKQRLSWPS